MPETIYKLQPNRTMALRGFDDLGASAAIHSATPNSFKVSGNFRDPADFAVLILYDADNFYEHPHLKYLPDQNFAGLTLTFDVHYQGLMPLDSPKYPSIDWRFLDVIRTDGSKAQIPLIKEAQQVGGSNAPAQAEFIIEEAGLKEYDRLTLWYLNLPFDYLVPKLECAYTFVAGGGGTVHSITVAGTVFAYTEVAGDSDVAIAQGVVNSLSASQHVNAIRGDGTPDLGSGNQVNLRAKTSNGAAIPVSSTSNQIAYTLYGVTASVIAADFASQINGLNWNAVGALIHLRAEATGETLRLFTVKPGYDGNMLSMYSISKNNRLRTRETTARFTGGSSDATWRVTLNFSTLTIPQVRLMWLTFAPPLANGRGFEDLEWQATFTNWTLTGPEEIKQLKVASPNSVRVEEDDAWCTYTGNWTVDQGFYSEGYAKRTATVGDAIKVTYACPNVHDLYIGTSLYTDRGIVGVKLDNDTETDLNCFLQNEPAVIARRKVRTSVPAGEHVVHLRLKSGQYFYFDFLEAVVPSDVPDSLAPRGNLSPALDYSTDHTYKLPPARLMWMFERLGFTGPMNEYIGVFWWNQRKRVGATVPSVEVTFDGNFLPNDQISLSVGGQAIIKTVFANETNASIARHFECFFNADSVGVWATATENRLTLTARSPKPAYAFSFQTGKVSPQGSSGAINYTGSFQNGNPGKWEIDTTQTPALNRGARDWHADIFRECQPRGREYVIACSMELVYPPAGFGAVYPDGQVVETDVGFANLKSTHCAFVDAMQDYQKQVYKNLADLAAAAGILPNIQFGEFLWWFFTNKTAQNPAGGMGLYHPEIAAAGAAALGRPLHKFIGPDDDPTVNASADAIFFRNRLRDHITGLIAHIRGFHANAKFELLFPYDVNHPTPAGVHNLGGKLNRFINLPIEYERKETSGLDRIKMEALDFGAWSRNLDLAETAIMFPINLGWPKDSIRHLIPVFKCGYPWEKEFGIAAGIGIPFINLWAFDHVCIYGWPLVRGPRGRSIRFS